MGSGRAASRSTRRPLCATIVRQRYFGHASLDDSLTWTKRPFVPVTSSIAVDRGYVAMRSLRAHISPTVHEPVVAKDEPDLRISSACSGTLARVVA